MTRLSGLIECARATSVIGLFLFGLHAFAGEAKLVQSERSSETNSDISWKQPTWPVGPDEVVRLEGHFKRSSDWFLLVSWTESPVPTRRLPDESQDFTLSVPLTDRLTPVTLFAIGPDGSIVQDKFIIAYDDWKGAQPQEAKRTRIYEFVPSLGFSTIAYSESFKPDFSETAVTAKASYLHDISPNLWNLGITGYFTALPLSSNQSGVTSRFYGLNFRVGYVVPQITASWRFMILAGYYYLTMSTSNGGFGFQNLSGPQLFPTLRKTLSSSNTISAYLKYSPVGSGFQLESLGNRELAFGISWGSKLGNDHPYSVTTDYSNLSFSIEESSVSSSTFTLGFGYGL